MNQPNPQALLKGLQLFQKAQALHAAKSFAPAADAYRQALNLVPDHPQMLVGYGQLAEDVGDWPGAERIYRRLLALTNINNLDGKLAVTLYQQERYEEAIPLFAAYTGRNPQDAVALRFLSTCCFRLMRWDEAIRYAQQSWRAEKHPDAICLEIATYLELGQGAPLVPLVEEALARFPDHWQVRKLAAEHLLKAGDYARGFRYFTEMRIPVGGAPHYVENIALPWWDGKPFAGTLLVGAEQGIGDEILTASMYADLVAMQQRAIIEADPRLLTILQRAFPSLTFVARNQRVLESIADGGGDFRKIISGNLGSFFRSTPGWQSPEPGWLHADPESVGSFAQAYGHRWPACLLVGLSWKSQRILKSGARKDVALTEFTPILDVAKTAFVNLQYGNIDEDVARLPDRQRLFVDPDVDTMNDMEKLFAQIAALDLVITTSSVTAHIAGAMGKPCWVILPRERPVIWYWGYSGETTPWYPHARLFRNTKDDDWTAVIARIADALRAVANEQARHRSA